MRARGRSAEQRSETGTGRRQGVSRCVAEVAANTARSGISWLRCAERSVEQGDVRQRTEAEQKQQRLEEAIHGITYRFPDELRKLEPGLAVLAFALGEQLARKDDTNQEWQRLLAECLGSLGEVRLSTGDHRFALQALQQSLAIREALAKEHADQPLLQRQLATGYQQLGDWYTLKRNHAWAIAKYQSALDIRARLAHEDESYGKLQEELASTHAKIGSVQVATADFTAAIASYREAIAIQERLGAQDPTNARCQKDLATTYETASSLLKSTGDDIAGATAYRAKAHRLKAG